MMKKTTLIFLFIYLIVNVYSQAPEMINYQAVVRDASGNTINSTSVPVTLTISDGTNSYIQRPTNITTNSYGLINLEIGPIAGSPSAIDWSSGSLQNNFKY